MLGDDVKRRGISFGFPEVPMNAPDFVALLTEKHAMSPDEYPAEAPFDVH